MKLTVTGHRPQKLGGFNNRKVHKRIYNAMEEMITKIIRPDLMYIGMAVGVDQWAAHICHKAKIPFIAAVPFSGQDLKWPQHVRDQYRALLSKAHQVVYVDREPGYISSIVAPGVYHSQKLLVRNKWMIDQLGAEDGLLAVVTEEGRYRSGSANCINNFRQSHPNQQVHWVICDRLINPKYDPLDDVPF